MRTEELIRALAADGVRPVAPISRSLRVAWVLSIVLACALFAAALHPRADLLNALQTPAFLFKLIVVMTLVATAATLLPEHARPTPRSRNTVVILIAPALLVGGVLFELLTEPANLWASRLIGHNAAHCVSLIPPLSVSTAACLLIALRRGAAADPTAAGAVAGLAAGAVGATLYALTCPDDSPLFVATWYSISILLVMAVTAAIGRRLLRW